MQPHASGQGPTTGSSTINGKNVSHLDPQKRMKRLLPSNANWQNVYLIAKWNGGSTFNTYNGLFTGSDGTGTAGGIGIIG